MTINANAEAEARVSAKKRLPISHMVTRIPGLHWLLVIVPLAYMVILTFFSMIELFKLAIFDGSGFTLKYLTILISSPVYLQVLWLTVKTSFLVTVFTLIFGYPVAYLLVRTESAVWKKVILAGVLIPFWLSLLVRSFAWTILLQDQGVINKLLVELGLIERPLPLLYNTTGVIIGMTHVLLPYMVLSLYSVMAGIDQVLLQAAQGMGARPLRAFFQVFFPLTLPGVLSGSLLVFVLGVGFFTTPALLGGSNDMMISMLIQNNISTTLNWNLASALSLLLFVVTMLLLLIPYLIIRNNAVVKDVS
jgi:ABC-type spermidine/putrescine transport system permease subunit I